MDFTITTSGEPQAKGTVWYATPKDGGKTLVVGNSYAFSDGDGPHRGIAQDKTLGQVPRLYFDRHKAVTNPAVGLWAHFMWPTIVAESYGGHHFCINSYDRARFTFGFYQLAAHTPEDNLILLFRKLLTLPTAKTYFPELTLKDGRVHHVVNGTPVSLETVTAVHRPNGKIENQIVAFMTFLNPDTHNVGNTEARNAARLIRWLLDDPAALAAAEAVPIGIARRKLASLAKQLKLANYPVEMAIWASDIRHQGRGSVEKIKLALAAADDAARLNALFAIGSENQNYDGRRKTVRKWVEQLQTEGVFKGVKLGSPQLPF